MTTATKSSTLRKAGLFYLVFVMFSYTTGGPFGLEDMVTTSGPGMTLIYLLLLPFFWCIPVSLVSAELTTAMPVEGGFYRWTRAAFGDFWGFLAGWWNWSASFLLGGAYAVLFTDYLVYYFPGLRGWKHYLVSVALIAVITWINVRGIQMVGKVATALEIFIFLPVMTMIIIALTHWHFNPFVPLIPPHQPTFKIFGVGLALGLWLYSGYEQLSTVAEEVENPQRAYPSGIGTGCTAVSCSIFSAHTRGPRLGRQLGNLAHRIFFGCGKTDRRTVAGYMDDTGCNDLQCGPAQQYRAHDHAHAVRYGGRRLPFRRAYAPALSLWHALAGDCFINGHLFPACLAESGAAHLNLYLAAFRHDCTDSAFGLETPPHASRDAARICCSWRKHRITLCSWRAGNHGDCGAAWRRPLRHNRGRDCDAARAGRVLDTDKYAGTI